MKMSFSQTPTFPPLMIVSGLMTFPRDLDIFSPFSPSVNPWTITVLRKTSDFRVREHLILRLSWQTMGEGRFSAFLYQGQEAGCPPLKRSKISVLFSVYHSMAQPPMNKEQGDHLLKANFKSTTDFKRHRHGQWADCLRVGDKCGRANPQATV